MKELCDFSFAGTAALIRSASVAVFGRTIFDFTAKESGDIPSLYESLLDSLDAFAAYRSLDARGIAYAVSDYVYELKRLLLLDAESIFDSDPAATDPSEVIACYPGFFAIFCHRMASRLYRLGVPVLPRMISEYAHSLTGIDIHPGATVGERFSIDHGTGVVIGETAVIGNRVKIYQGVTIGARSFPRDTLGGFDRSAKRHPTICDGCVIYACATILGADTVIGEGAVIGANTRVSSSVPPYTKIYYEKGK